MEMRALGLQHLSSEALGLEMGVGRSIEMQGNWSTVVCEESISGLDGQWPEAVRARRNICFDPLSTHD